MYIKDFICSWSTKSSHSIAPIYAILFISFKIISSLVFVGFGGSSCCFDKYVHPFTSLFIISTRLLLLHLRIPISSSYLLLPFTSSFIISTRLLILHFCIPISSSSLLLYLLQCGWAASESELEVFLVDLIVRVFLLTKHFFKKS